MSFFVGLAVLATIFWRWAFDDVPDATERVCVSILAAMFFGSIAALLIGPFL